MKMAVVVSYFPLLSEVFLVCQIRGLIRAGHDVHVYARRPPVLDATCADLAARVRYRPGRMSLLRRLLSAPGWYLRSSGEARQVLRKSLNVLRYGRRAAKLHLMFDAAAFDPGEQYDVVHCHWGYVGAMAVRLRELGTLRAPMVCTFHGFDAMTIPPSQAGEKYGHLFSNCEMFTAPCRYTVERLKGLGCPEDKILCVPMGVATEKLKFRPRRVAPGEPVRVITVARLVEVKGVEYGIRAVAALLKSGVNVTYDVIGDGRLRGELQGLIDGLHVGDLVHLLGARPHDETAALLDRSHIFVLASAQTADGVVESQGTSVQEAQACGLPVVVSDSGGIPEGMLDGRSGFVVPKRDVSAMAAKLAWLIDHSEVWPEFGEAGRRFVEREFSIEKSVERMETAYREAQRRYRDPSARQTGEAPTCAS